MIDLFRNKILHGNVMDKLKELDKESVHCVVTSPPYYGVRNYGTNPQIWLRENGIDCTHQFNGESKKHNLGGASIKSTLRNTPGQKAKEGWTKGVSCEHEFMNIETKRNNGGGGDTEKQKTNVGSFLTDNRKTISGFCIHCGAWKGELGLEPAPELYVEHLVQIFREVRRVLRADGTCWLNLGDSYWGSGNASGHTEETENYGRKIEGYGATKGHTVGKHTFYKPKDLLLIPHRVAIALQQDGWWVRSDIVWSKKNPMPESVVDRPSKAHEYIFLLTKNQKYYYDAEAIREEPTSGPSDLRKMLEQRDRIGGKTLSADDPLYKANMNTNIGQKRGVGDPIAGRNKRSVWEVTTTPFSEAHFATMPSKLVEPCILAETSEHGVCAECGAPYERILEREKRNPSNGSRASGKSETELEKQYRRRESEHQIVPVDQPNRGSVDKIPRAESATKFDTETSTAGRLATYRQGARAYDAKYHTNEEGLFLNASERSITIQSEREESKIEAAELYPDDYAKQQWYINYVHEHGRVKQNRTIGWRKTCKCETTEVKPAIVLDPFFGAGTTGLVARKGNRDFLGIELNEKYITIAKKRLAAELEAKLL